MRRLWPGAVNAATASSQFCSACPRMCSRIVFRCFEDNSATNSRAVFAADPGETAARMGHPAMRVADRPRRKSPARRNQIQGPGSVLAPDRRPET